MKNRILLFLLSLLGFASACSTKEQVEMYGTPRVNLKTQGRATDTAGKPIAGIQVRSVQSEKTTLTAADGSYTLQNDAASRVDRLIFTDIDGKANGGEFVELTREVEFTDADRTEASEGWYGGAFAKTSVDVTLQEKE